MNETLQVFEQGWPGNDTVCGWGSTMEHTRNMRYYLPYIIRKFNIKSLNDAGCGDLFWIKSVIKGKDKEMYNGFDIYERASWEGLRAEGWKLHEIDITKTQLPPAELVLCRDVFIHLPNDMVLAALELFKKSHKYLLSTTYENVNNNDRMDKPRLQHAKLDLKVAPFNFGKPLIVTKEDFIGKSTCLWEL